MGKINRNTNYKYIIMNTKDPIELLAVNARLVSKQHPETFKLFSEEHLNHINSGDCVKIIHNGERFWFEVFEVKEHKIIGKISNELIVNKNILNISDFYIIDKNCVIDIFKKELTHNIKVLTEIMVNAPKFSNLIQVHNYCNEPIFLNTYLKYSN